MKKNCKTCGKVFEPLKEEHLECLDCWKEKHMTRCSSCGKFFKPKEHFHKWCPRCEAKIFK